MIKEITCHTKISINKQTLFIMSSLACVVVVGYIVGTGAIGWYIFNILSTKIHLVGSFLIFYR